MFKEFFRKESEARIDSHIDDVLQEMRTVGVDSDEYPKLMTYLERLYEVKTKARQDPVSRDTMAIVAGNLAGILLIIAYEQKHVMTSKGFSQILRPRTPGTNPN